jgi:hypothetical protein
VVLSHLPVGDRWPRRNVPWMFVLKRGKKPMAEGQLEKADKKEVVSDLVSFNIPVCL